MIQATDLRIGNFIDISVKDEIEYPVEVYQILETSVFIDNNLLEDYGQAKFCQEYPLGEVKPIPLTEDWLIKLGFENRKALGQGWRKFEVDFWFDEDGLTIQSTQQRRNCQYVHEGQNLIYALTGQEITLTPQN